MGESPLHAKRQRRGGWMVIAPHEGCRESLESGGGARPPSMATNHKISVEKYVALLHIQNSLLVATFPASSLATRAPSPLYHCHSSFLSAITPWRQDAPRMPNFESQLGAL